MAWSTVGEKKGEEKRATRNKVVGLHQSAEAAGQEKPEGEGATERNRDLRGGMELLELDFLLSIVENTRGNDQNDVTMRKLNFNEILRRSKQNQIDSNALTVYAVNAGDLYGKDIQCEATKELAKRTAK